MPLTLVLTKSIRKTIYDNQTRESLLKEKDPYGGLPPTN
jgi:hypothetical protein